MAEKRPWSGSPPPAERTRLLDRVARGPQPGDRRLQPLGPRPERVAGSAFIETSCSSRHDAPAEFCGRPGICCELP
jgi:hypothetical protein